MPAPAASEPGAAAQRACSPAGDPSPDAPAAAAAAGWVAAGFPALGGALLAGAAALAGIAAKAAGAAAKDAAARQHTRDAAELAEAKHARDALFKQTEELRLQITVVESQMQAKLQARDTEAADATERVHELEERLGSLVSAETQARNRPDALAEIVPSSSDEVSRVILRQA